MMVFIKAFVIGGMICALTQILMEKTRLMPGRIMVLLVTLGTFLGAVGLYEPFAEFAGAGATVPLLGFGNVLWKGVREAVDANGFFRAVPGRVLKPVPSAYPPRSSSDIWHPCCLNRR